MWGVCVLCIMLMCVQVRMNTCGGQSINLECCSSRVVQFVLKTGSLTGTWGSPIRLGWAGQQGLGILLALSPSAEVISVSPCSAFCVVYGDQIEVLMPAEQALYLLSYFPTHQILLLCIFFFWLLFI